MTKNIVPTFFERYKFLLLVLGLVCFSLSPSCSQADEIKRPDQNLTQPVQGPIPDKINNPNPSIPNPSPELKSGGASQDPNPLPPTAIKIQEGTNAED